MFNFVNVVTRVTLKAGDSYQWVACYSPMGPIGGTLSLPTCSLAEFETTTENVPTSEISSSSVSSNVTTSHQEGSQARPTPFQLSTVRLPMPDACYSAVRIQGVIVLTPLRLEGVEGSEFVGERQQSGKVMLIGWG